MDSTVPIPSTTPTASSLRVDELRRLIAYLRRGQSCLIVGPSNSGKSRLLRTLLRDEARVHLAPPEAPPVIPVFVDCLMATESEAAFYELLLRQILGGLDQVGLPHSTFNAVKSMHAEILRGANPSVAQALFVDSLRILMAETNLRLVIILDELDDALCALPPWPFRTLRALRDEFCGRLCYVAGVSRRLERIRTDALLYEFREIFYSQTILLKPLSAEDCQICFDDVVANQRLTDVEPYRSLVIALAGGHPGLIKRVLLALIDLPAVPESGDPALAQRLFSAWPIQQECQRLWDELEIEEQDALLAYANGGANILDAAQRQALEDKGLLAFDAASRLGIFSLLFETFIQRRLNRMRQGSNKGVHCDFETGKIWANGKDITLELSDQQRKLLRFLYQRAGSVCTYQEIIDAVWGVAAGVLPSAIYELVKRARQKVEADVNQPEYLVTVRGEGYILQIPE